METSLELATRVARLEGQLRHTRAVALVALGLTGAVILVGQAAPPGPAGARWALKDGSGRERIVLSVDDKLDMPFINLRDKDGRRRLSLTLLRDGTPGILLRDGQGKTLAAMGCLPQEVRAALPEGFPPWPAGIPAGKTSGYFVLNDADGKEVFTAPQSP